MSIKKMGIVWGLCNQGLYVGRNGKIAIYGTGIYRWIRHNLCKQHR